MTKTYEIHIDESGDFECAPEDKSLKTPVRVIGGVVIPPELKEKEAALKEEMMALAQPYYIKELKRVTDIHISDKDKLKDSSKQNELREKLSGFFNTRMSEAKIAFIYDVSDLTNSNELPGAQLYRHMLLKLLKALVFYHPGFADDSILEIKLAHRRIHYPRAHDLGLAKQGYLKVRVDKEVWFTAINEKDVKSIMLCLQDSLGFKNIRKASYEMMPYSEWDSPFMTAADMICNKIFGIAAECGRNTERFHKQLLRNFGRKEERIFFYCSSDYELPENILTHYYLNRPGDFIAEWSRMEGNERHKYSDNTLTLSALEKSAHSLSTLTMPDEYGNILKTADKILHDRLYSRLGIVSYLIERVREKLEIISEGNTPDLDWDTVAYLYHDVCLRYNNHTANVVAGKRHGETGIHVFNRFHEKNILKSREHHEFVNRVSVMHSNAFAFEKAISILKDIERKEEAVSHALTSGGTFIKNEILGKIYGSLGQNYAFRKNWEEAGGYFLKAREHLGGNNPMQASYRAHLAIETKDRNAYENELNILFRKDSFPGIEPLLNECMENLDSDIYVFNLHILLKGLITFYQIQNESYRNLILKVARQDSIIRNRKNQRAHPWQLIYILLGRLLLSVKEKDTVEWLDAGICFRGRKKEEVTFNMFSCLAAAVKAGHYLENGNISKAKEIIKEGIIDYLSVLKEEKIALGVFNPNKAKDSHGKYWPGWFDDVGEKLLNCADDAGSKELKEILNEFTKRFTFNYW